MRFWTIALLFASVVHCTPTPKDETTPRVLKRWALGDHTMTAYARSDDLPEPATNNDLVRRCSNDKPKCFGSHHASSPICGALVTGLGLFFNDAELKESPRAVCIEGSGQAAGKCCVSWASVVRNDHLADLFDAALNVYNTCSNGGRVSGLVRDAQVGGACTTVCISDRLSRCR
jgi:hypothetical protein